MIYVYHDVVVVDVIIVAVVVTAAGEVELSRVVILLAALNSTAPLDFLDLSTPSRIKKTPHIVTNKLSPGHHWRR